MYHGKLEDHSLARTSWGTGNKAQNSVLTKVFLNRIKARSLVIVLIFLNLSLILLQLLKKSKYISSGVRNPKAWCIWILTWQPNFCLFWRRLEILVIGWSWTNWSWRLPETVWGWTHPQISASPHHKPASLCLPRSLQTIQLCLHETCQCTEFL